MRIKDTDTIIFQISADPSSDFEVEPTRVLPDTRQSAIRLANQDACPIAGTVMHDRDPAAALPFRPHARRIRRPA
jgi:hypothetical protein